MKPEDSPSKASPGSRALLGRPESLALLVATAILLLTPLGAQDLWAPDEPRYAQVAEEVRAMEHGPSDLVLLHLNGEPYTQKPPLYYWLAAGFGAPLGRVTEAAARLPSALSGIVVVALTLTLGARLVGARRALLGAVLLLTTFRFERLAQRVQLDVLLALLEMLALFAFWRMQELRRRPRALVLAMHGAMGLAVLTKGPVGLLVPALVVATTLAWDGRAREWFRLFVRPALALSVGPGLAWVVAAAALAPEGYLGEAVGTNLIGRFFQGTSHARPFYYYGYKLPIDLLPASLLLPAVILGWRAARALAPDRRPGSLQRRFLAAWVLAPLVFFSISTGKRGLYLVPSFPAACLLLADLLPAALTGSHRAQRWVCGVAAGLATVLGTAALGLLVTGRSSVSGIAFPSPFALSVLATIILAALLAAPVARRLLPGIPGARSLAGLLVGAYLLELAASWILFPANDPMKSPRPIAEAAAALTPDRGAIGLLGRRSLTGGIVYYSGHPVKNLDSADEARAFFAAGGRALIAREKHLELLQEAAPVEVRARLRDEGRAMVVVAPRPTARPAPRRPVLPDPS